MSQTEKTADLASRRPASEGPPSSRPPRSRDESHARRWVAPALRVAGLLLLPAVAWLAFPARARAPLQPPARLAAAEVARASADPRAPRSPTPDSRARTPTASGLAAPPSDAPDAGGLPVVGLVLGPNDAPIADATVGCDDGRDVDRVDTDVEGRFRLQPEAEGCKGVARHPRFGRSAPVVLAAGGGNVLRVGSSSGIEGVVVDDSGAPVSPYFLYVESFSSASDRKELDYQRYVDDPKGAFRWSGLPPGRYVLLASADGRAPSRSAPIDLSEEKPVKDVTIVVSPGAKLEGVVVDAQTKSPIAGATVGLYMTGPYGLVLRAPASTGPDGSFTMTGLPPGPFPLRSTGKGYENKLFPEVVAGGGRQTFPLAREASN